VRLQAALHCCLLMCVPRSQKFMQSCSPLPPPPGVLGALSLGLVVPDARPPEDGVASVRGGDEGGTPRVPAEEGLVGTVVCGVCAEEELGAATGGGDSGATGATRGAGVPVADGPVGLDGDGAVRADGAADVPGAELCPTAAPIGTRAARLTAMPAAQA
jgi:hypothetical protein